MSNKTELLRIIEDQKAKLDKYEKKLKDVIQAYKSLLNEKTALEQSLKALASNETDENETQFNETNNIPPSSISSPGTCVQVLVTDDNNRTVDSSETSEIKADDNESIASNDTEDSTLKTSFANERSSADRAKFATLKRALATISAEKSRQEVAFTEDRKRLINEQDTLREQLEKQKDQLDETQLTFDRQLNELRSTIRQLQCERECETSDHGAMLKELQQKLANERSQNEYLTKQNTTLSAELKTKEQQPIELLERISVLNAEIAKLKEKLFDAESKLKELPNLVKLENDLAQTRIKHQLVLETEQKRTQEFQTDVGVLRNHYEERIGELEGKISELVATVGTCERVRQEDADTIEKLKSRVVYLEHENQTFATGVNSGHCKDDDESFPVLTAKCQQLIEKLKSFQGLNETQDIFAAIGLDSLLNGENLHKQCKKDLDALRDDYEKYKLRFQALLKSKNVSKQEMQDNSEVVHLRQMVVNLQQKLQGSKEHQKSNEDKCVADLDDLRRSISLLKDNHVREIMDLEQKCHRRIVDMESETLKQRERTLEVLVEKEKEIAAMRAIIGGNQINSAPLSASKMRSESRSSFHSVDGGAIDSDSSRRNDNETFATPADPAPTSLYYNQELSRKEKEIVNLKRDLRRMESQLIETQHAVVTKELIHFEITEKLKDEIRNVETKLARSSDSSNVEYLKNVFIQFALCEDTVNKQHMLKAIAASLKLSYKETDILLKHYVKNAWFVKGSK